MKNYLINFCILLITLIVCLFIAEIAVRLFLPDVLRQNEDFLFKRDNNGYPVHIKNYDGYITSTESKERIHLKTNSEGFMGNDYSINKPTDKKRVALFGDSFTEALQVSTEDSFSYLLEKTLPNYEIMNFGVSAIGTVESFLNYEYYGKKYNPDLVVYIFCSSNDIIENMPYEDIFFSQRENIVPVKIERNDLKYKILKTSRLVQWGYYFVKENNFLFEISKKIGLQHERGYVPVSVNQQETSEKSDKAFNFTVEVIDEFSKAVNNNGSKFITIIIPRAVDMAPNNRLREALESRGILVYDLADILTPDDFLNRIGHFNKEGHSAVSVYLKEIILEHAYPIDQSSSY